PLQEARRVLDQRGIALRGDVADAGSRAALDLVEQAGPRPVREEAVRAGAEQERLLQLVQRAVDRAGGGEGAEIAPLLAPGSAMLAEQRPGAVLDQDMRKALVVAQQHVEAGLQLLDEIRLEQQRLGLRRRGDEL